MQKVKVGVLRPVQQPGETMQKELKVCPGMALDDTGYVKTHLLPSTSTYKSICHPKVTTGYFTSEKGAKVAQC